MELSLLLLHVTSDLNTVTWNQFRRVLVMINNRPQSMNKSMSIQGTTQYKNIL